MSGTLTKVPSSKRTSQLLRRAFTAEGEPGARRQLESSAGAELDKPQDEFFEFLDSELNKIDAFYVVKEQEATEKLRVLRQQLHIMRDQRIQEVLAAKRAAQPDNAEAQQRANAFAKLNGSRLKGTFAGKNRFGKNSEALAEMATPGMHAQDQDREFIVNRRDFMRRQEPPNQEVSYRSAKHKLKHALQEFYRGVELLKGYAYLNRTAFRKINKKYDKAVNARPPLRYMSEKVNKTSFVQSEVTESLMTAVEDLYARYFERGNRKIAISKLRHTINKSGDYSPNTFRSGLLLMGGALFSIKGLVDATSNLRSGEVAEQIRTSYLLQVGFRSSVHCVNLLTNRVDLWRIFPDRVSRLALLLGLHDLDKIEDQLCICFRIRYQTHIGVASVAGGMFLAVIILMTESDRYRYLRSSSS
jgi:hypothetical protein